MKKIFLLILFFTIFNIKANYTPYSQVADLFPYGSVKPIMEKNRKTLSQIPCWIEEHVYKNAIYWYGLPETVRHLIDKPIGAELTYSDALGYFSKMFNQVNYLELGVSVGKNFYQVANIIAEGTITGFDFEEINPTLEKLFTDKTIVDSWPTIENSLKKNNSSLTTYKLPEQRNEIAYLCGDVSDENTWSKLAGRKFNLIFSDAFHSAESLLFEYDMIEKYDLLDSEEFIMVWDDLGGAMSDAFYIIASKLEQKYPLDTKVILPMRGWLGMNEHHHNVGIIMKLRK